MPGNEKSRCAEPDDLLAHPTGVPVPMTSIQYVQLRLSEAVETAHERSENEQSHLLARLLAVAFAAAKKSPVAV